MAINLVNGQMLNSTLERDGVSIAIVNSANSTPTLFVDVGNTFVGINTNTPTAALTVGGDATATNLFLSNDITANGTITGNNLSASHSVSANFINATNISASGNISASNITATGSGPLNLGNLAITNTTITSASVGNLVIIGGTDGFVIPVGNVSQRPGSPTTGVTRFNTTSGDLEIFNGSTWVSNTGSSGTITDQQITPDGSSTTYTLNQTATVNSIIVSVNGVLQLPTEAYTVSGTTITFSNPPRSTDIIDIRFISYVTTIDSLSNGSGNSYVTVSNTPSINFGVAGNVAATINAEGVLQIYGQSLQLPSYTVLQTADIISPVAGQVVFTSNGDSGNPSLAVYDGTSWKRVALGATISAT